MIRITAARRFLFFLGMDTTLIALSVLLAFALRFDGQIPRAYAPQMAFIALVATVAIVGTLWHFHVYRISWRYVGLRDLGVLALGVALATLLLAIVAQMLYMKIPHQAFPRSIVFILAPLVFLALSGFRLSKRAVISFSSGPRGAPDGKAALLVGAGNVGEQVLNSMHDPGARRAHRVVGFVDDDPLAHGTMIQGVPVLGALARIGDFIETYRVESVVICVAAASSTLVRDVVERCKKAGVDHVRIVPPVSQIVDGRVTYQSTRDVTLDDLLGRKPVKIRNRDLDALLEGKRVLVTGGAGTIGAELARQVALHHPERLVVLDVDETRLHDTVLDLQQTVPHLDVVAALVDVRDLAGLEELFRTHRPEIVFHAAAYKHVPMMEQYPVAALEVNVLGTANVARLAAATGAERFVLISTDKAVEPVNVMGASKRLAEMVVLGGNGTTGLIRSAVRFGNVIGSRGSVIPIFERQIARGGPVTVTHPDIERYFMITSEAVSLVLQAAAIGDGGDLFVLDMGQPVKILEVAREFCRLKGLEPDVDIAIVFTGLRPGERLKETLHYDAEEVVGTDHPRVMRATGEPDTRGMANLMDSIAVVVADRDTDGALRLLGDCFPSFQPPGAVTPVAVAPK